MFRDVDNLSMVSPDGGHIFGICLYVISEQTHTYSRYFDLRHTLSVKVEIVL